jgi:hypothetical protein
MKNMKASEREETAPKFTMADRYIILQQVCILQSLAGKKDQAEKYSDPYPDPGQTIPAFQIGSFSKDEGQATAY